MVRRMAMPRSSYDAGEIVRLAELSGITPRVEDAEVLAAALSAHCEMVAPLFGVRLENAPVATTFDPRWRG